MIAAFYWSSRRVVVVVVIIMVASIERARSRVKLCTTMRERGITLEERGTMMIMMMSIIIALP